MLCGMLGYVNRAVSTLTFVWRFESGYISSMCVLLIMIEKSLLSEYIDWLYNVGRR